LLLIFFVFSCCLTRVGVQNFIVSSQVIVSTFKIYSNRWWILASTQDTLIHLQRYVEEDAMTPLPWTWRVRLIRQAAQEAARLGPAKLPQIVAAVRRFVQLLESDLENMFYKKNICETFNDRFICIHMSLYEIICVPLF